MTAAVKQFIAATCYIFIVVAWQSIIFIFICGVVVACYF